MDWHFAYTPWTWPAIVSTAFTAALSVYGWCRRGVPGALPFAAFTLCGTLWALGSALEMTSAGLSAKVFWAKFQSACQLPMVTAELWFALEYADLRRWLTRRNLILLAVLPSLWWILISTNDVHHLLWSGFSLQGLVLPARNAAAWIFIAYGYLLGCVTLLVFAGLFWRSPPHRVPVALCLCGQITVRAAYALKASAAFPALPLDPVVLALDVGAFLFACALFRYHLFHLIPIARGTVIDQMREGMLVLDSERRIVDLNLAAGKILGIDAANAKGKDAIQILNGFTQLKEILSQPVTDHSEASIEVNGGAHYALHMSLLRERHGHPLGRLILFHDMTEQRRSQSQLLEQQRALATLEERDRIARELHDSIGQVLGYAKMQGQAARHLLAQGQTEKADSHLARLIAVAQEAHADVREFILGTRSGMSAGRPFVPSLDAYLMRFGEVYGIATQLNVEPQFTSEVIEPMVEAQLLRIIQETLTNVRKHAGASRVSVRLGIAAGCAEATVQDDGVGFNPNLGPEVLGQRYGLLIMRERAGDVGGSVDIRSGPGEGTSVIVRVPVKKEPA